MARLKFTEIIQQLHAGHRNEQIRLADDIARHGLTKKLSGFNASTGIGKTMSYLAEAMQQESPIIVSVPTHQLAEQVMSTAQRINRVLLANGLPERVISHKKGRQEYMSVGRTKRALSVCEDTQDNIQLALRAALLSACESSNKDSLITEFITEYGGLPDGISRRDICCNIDDKDSALLDSTLYEQQQSDFIVVSHVLTVIPHGLKSLPKQFRSGILIIDEADALVNIANSIFSKKIALSTLLNVATSLKGSVITKASGELSLATKGLREGVTMLSQDGLVTDALLNFKSALGRYTAIEAIHLEDKLDDFFSSGMNNAAIIKTDNKSRISQFSKFAARGCATVFDAYQHVCLLSGTLDVTSSKNTHMKWLLWQLGYEEEDLKFYGFYEPKEFGRISLFIAGQDYPKPTIAYTDGELNPSFTTACATTVIDQSSGHVLVNTSSYREAWRLADELEKQSNGKINIIADNPLKPLPSVISEFQENDDAHVILITPRTSAGVDIRKKTGGQLFKHMFITKLPFSPPPDLDELEHLYTGSKNRQELSQFAYIDSMQASTRKTAQVFGRAIRASTDECSIYILDNRFPRYDKKSAHSMLKGVIPLRFVKQYVNATYLDNPKSQPGAKPNRQMVF
ncbi:MAG: helicase C-terminal domain-containing protein [Colwellia sp.]|jgi:DEAD/DEAH box helicase.